jgi:hypothetical protein
MEIKTTVKADTNTKEIEDIRSDVVFKYEKNFVEYLNNLLNDAFQLGRTYEIEKWINKLDCKE